jgi:hypothetical protein
MLVVYCCCWRKPGLWIDDRVVKMKFIRNRMDRGLIRLDKRRNLVSEWHFRCPCGLGMD